MPNPRSQPEDDLQASGNLKRIDDLEIFRKEFEGKEFDKKIITAIDESSTLQKKIKELIWDTFKDKIIWVILTVIVLLTYTFFSELIKRLAGTVHF